MKVFKHLKETFKHNIKSLYKKSFSFNNRKRILHRRYRKISFIVIALLVIVNMTIFTFSALSQNVVSFGTVQGSTLNKGLVGHWSMDAVEYNSSTNRVTDKTPYSSHGTNYGATFTTDRNGKTDGAMSFDGSNDYIDCGNSIFRNHDTFTVGLWFNRYSDLASYTNHGVYNMLLAKASGAYNDNFELGTNGNNIQLYLDTSISNETRSFPAGILNNEFYYLAVTFDNGLAKIYVNGEFIDSSDWSGTLDSNADLSVFAIGESQHAGAPFNGLIDDVRIYNRVLSESEIQSLYDSYEPKISAGSLNKGLVLDMPLTLKYTKDETAGSEIMTDKTPYSNDGQNNGATITAEGASFDGVDDFIDINSFNYPSSWKQPFSLSSWVYIPSSYSWNTSRMSNIIGRGYYTGSLGLVMGTSDNTIRGWVRGDNGSTSASGSITRDNWHHASMIWDGSIVSLYIDGELVSSSSTLNLEGVPDANIWQLGYPLAFSGSSGSQYEGRISNIFMYNRALSDTEVRSLYDKGRDTGSGMTIRPYGSVSGMAGLSCLDILNNNPSAINNDSLYWINPDGTGSFQVYCDMTTDGGGWTAVWKNFAGPEHASFGTNVSDQTLWANPSTYNSLATPYSYSKEAESVIQKNVWDKYINSTNVDWLKHGDGYDVNGNPYEYMYSGGGAPPGGYLHPYRVKLDFGSSVTMNDVMTAADCAALNNQVGMLIYNSNYPEGYDYGSTDRVNVYSAFSKGFANSGDACGQTSANLMNGWGARHVLSYNYTTTGRDTLRCQFECWGTTPVMFEAVWFARESN